MSLLTLFSVASIPARKMTCPPPIAVARLIRMWDRGVCRSLPDPMQVDKLKEKNKASKLNLGYMIREFKRANILFLYMYRFLGARCQAFD